MDGMVLGVFLFATFLGAVVSGLAGMGMGLVLLGMWAHILTPVQIAILIVGYSLLTVGYAIWKLRHALSWRRLAPFIIGGAVGAPIGAMLLTYIDPVKMRPAIGLLLVLYSVYALARPAFKPVQAGFKADLGIGVLNGLLGGLTGLVGIIVTIWCQLRGWSKDVQRTVFQPVMVAASALTAASLIGAGAVTAETVELYLLGLPLLLAGLWLGLKLYGRLDEAAFRKVILLLLLVSGLALIVPASIFAKKVSDVLDTIGFQGDFLVSDLSRREPYLIAHIQRPTGPRRLCRPNFLLNADARHETPCAG